ncbi:unnamed protein product [Rotaria socialis]|uniref:Uncharacterized protein n=4 Tax=Rotaria socialis TaxID=392032 RepID=A0A820GDQ7_9BILA|nr:unnamed protein product [Rotaria socialis]CAF4276738.1 unnamed protein product [Rotaria socialis]CAF4392321.1 unnamed protein product [Rotaria socialis]
MTIVTTNQNHIINFEPNNIDQLAFSSINKLLIAHNQNNASLIFSSIINTKETLINSCYNNNNNNNNKVAKRNTKEPYRSDSTSSTVITFNSSSYIDYHSQELLDYPLRLSLRFRTLGRISNGVLLSLTQRKSSSLIIPFFIIEHSNGKIEITVLQLDERKVLSTVTSVQCGKNVNNDNWHWLQVEIDQSGIFTLVVDDDSRTSQIPSYVVSSWNLNAVLVGDTRRLSSDIFQPFIGYMSELLFNDENLFEILTKSKDESISNFYYDSQHLTVGYRVAFFNLVTVNTQKSYIAFSERENQNKNHGKLDIYFLFRSYVPDGIILYRYAQGLNEYFAIGLRAGILALFIDFGFGKRQIVSNESIKLADGKWHEVRVTRIGTDKIELVVDNRANRSTLSANGIRNAVSLQPVLYVGGIPNNNNINLTGSGLNAHGFQGCLSSFIVDGRLLDYQRALVLNGQVKMNVCSDLNKLCYDFTCVHSGACSINENDEPSCDCVETSFIGERCDKLPKGFYFGKHHSIGTINHIVRTAHQGDYDIISFGLQTLSTSAQILRLESEPNLYSLEYEIVREQSYMKLYAGTKQPDIYSAVVQITDGVYHAIKIIRRLSTVELYVDGIRIKLEGETKLPRQLDQPMAISQKRLRIGSFKNVSHWNGIIAGLSFNRQPVFDSLSNTLTYSGDVAEAYPDKYTDQFNLVDSFYIATAIISSTATTAVTSIISRIEDSSEPSTETTLATSTISVPILDSLYHQDYITQVNLISDISYQTPVEWFYKQLKYIGVRGLIISAIISVSLLALLLFLILCLHCKTRHTRKKLAYQYKETNGNNAYAPIKAHTNILPDGRNSKKRVPKILRYLHANQSKPLSFRLTSNGSLSRLNSGDSYHLISALQENHKEQRTPSYKTSDCLDNDHCCVHPSFSQPAPASASMYHQVNRLMLSSSEPPLPLPNITAHRYATPISSTLRSVKKDIDNSSSQTYSAVYSCELAANLDTDQELFSQFRSPIKRRSVIKPRNSMLMENQILYLYTKSLVDCHALQSNNYPTVLLATADENRIQLLHAHSGNFHSQLPISSVGACHTMIFSRDGQFLIGLFYEVTSNVNPYAVKIWSTDDYSIRTNLHPIKCSIAVTSRHSPILYMAGKQKYGRGISLGLLDLDSCCLARELKSDPDTSIGDEIKRIILTKNESYALVACTEYSSTFACFVVFKLEAAALIPDEPSSLITGSMSNCTMILTRFDCNPSYTFSIVDTNNNGDQYMLTVLRTNEIIIWQLNDGEIIFNYNFNYLFDDTNKHELNDCQMNDNRLLIFAQPDQVFIWDVTVPLGQFLFVTSICDPLIHSISWFDHRHFLSIDRDGQRIRTWSINRKEVLNQSLSLQGSIQSLHVHSICNNINKQKQHFIVGLSTNERSLMMFEYNQLYDDDDDHTDSSNNMIIE